MPSTETPSAARKRAEQSTSRGSIAVGGIVAISISLILGWMVFSTVYGIPLGGGPPAASGGSTTASTPTGPGPTIYLTISTLPDGADQYVPANFSVPANEQVTFVISNYDNGVNNVSAAASTVTGTVGSTESISGGAAGVPQGPVSSLGPGLVAHTFTVSAGSMYVNAVVPPALDSNHAVTVTFQVEFTTAGSYIWFCQAPCDGTSMQTPGFMTGTLTVT